MSKDSLIAALQEKLEQADGLAEETRANLLALVDQLREPSAAGTEDEEEPHGLGRVTRFVEELEAEHPELAAMLGQVATTLSKMGI